jgi:hypothetical protein
MNLKQIRDECRILARDTAANDSARLWPNAEMNRYINRIVRHVARETKCIRDAVTPSICLIASAPVDYTTYTEGTLDYIWANDATSWLYQLDVCPYLYALDDRILQIDEAKWTTCPWKLTKVSVAKWQQNPWWEQVTGMPTEYATDLTNGYIALNYRSTTSDTLRLQVRRLPLTDLAADTDEPEFRSQYHDFLLNGVMWLMYSKRDAETLDKAKADEFKIAFLRDVDEIKNQEATINQRLQANSSLNAFR